MWTKCRWNRAARCGIRTGCLARQTAELEATQEMFAAIEAAQPHGVRYASCKLPDDETYVILLEHDDDEDNPLLAIPAFNAVQDDVKNWIAEPPTVEQLTLVGSYRLFRPPARRLPRSSTMPVSADHPRQPA